MAPQITGRQTQRRCQLTEDTGKALCRTCSGTIALIKYLINSGYRYVVLGKFTIDLLQKMLGKLRQGSSGTYYINTKQILEKGGIYNTKLI